MLVVVGEAVVGKQVPVAGVQEQLGVVDRLDELARGREVSPSEIEFGELNKTSTGTVKKYELRERARSERLSESPLTGSSSSAAPVPPFGSPRVPY